MRFPLLAFFTLATAHLPPQASPPYPQSEYHSFSPHFRMCAAEHSRRPADFTELRCAVAQFALEFASTKLSASALPEVSDALNIDWLCANVTSASSVFPAQVRKALTAAKTVHAAARERSMAVAPGTIASFFVSTTGADTNPGTISAPFLTLQRAAAAARSITPRSPGDVTIFIRGGKYRLGATGSLALSAEDSNVTWSAYPGDDSPAVLSGSLLLPALSWTNYSGGEPGILVAPVAIPDARAKHWAAESVSAGPPPLVASLFIDGVRAVRARWPNGNPSDGSGPCFVPRSMWPNEGCTSWSHCAVNATAYQAAPVGVVVTGVAPDRGSSPTLGCSDGCHNCGNFSYTIYPPPSGHPVYNVPLPGIGWTNTSVFSKWPSPFYRAASFNVSSTGSSCSHWARAATYAEPAGAVISSAFKGFPPLVYH